MPHIDSSMNHDCIGSLGSFPNEPKTSDKLDSHTTIPLLLEVFMEQGIPNKIRCDCGSNFTSLDFASFCSDLGISFSFHSSYHHQSVPAECSVRTVKIS